MAAVEKREPPLPPRANAGMASLAIRQSRIIRRPICTHTTVNRVRDVACSMCSRVPEQGWVYQCRQDHQLRKDDSLPDVDCMPTVPDECDYFDAKSRVAEYLKMNPSIIKAIRAGDYDLDQIDNLLAQREKVIRAIMEQEGGSKEDTPPPSFDGVIASVGTTTYADCRTSISMPRRDSLAVQPTNVQPTKCSYAICGGCRPYFKDRLYTSFESLGDQPPFTAVDMEELPMINPIIARTIGLRPSPETPLRSMPSHISMDVADGTDIESESEISVNWSATNSGESHSSGLDSLDNSELFPCPGSHHCPVWSRRSGCAYENGAFDDGKRAENHGFFNSLTPENSRSQLSHYADLALSTPGASSTTASSVSLPTTPVSPLIPLLPTDETFDVALQKQLKKSSENRNVSTPGGKRRKTEIGLHSKESKNSIISDADGDGEGGVARTH